MKIFKALTVAANICAMIALTIMVADGIPNRWYDQLVLVSLVASPVLSFFYVLSADIPKIIRPKEDSILALELKARRAKLKQQIAEAEAKRS